MAELDLTNIAIASIATPGTGVTAVTVDSADKRIKTKDDGGTVRVLVDRASAETLSNKDLDATVSFVDATDTTKELDFNVSGNTTGIILTLAAAQSTSQTLNVPNIAASDTIDTLGLAQAITGVKTMTNMTTLVGTATVPNMTLTPGGTVLTSPLAGAVETDAAVFYKTNNTTEGRTVDSTFRFFRLTANATPFTAITDFFGTNDGIGFPTNAVLEIEWHCYFAVAGLSTQILTWTITSTQTLTNMNAAWAAQTALANMATAGASTGAGVVAATATIALPNTGVLVIGNHYHIVRAIIECATAGNLRLRAASASTETVGPLRGSYFKVRRLPALNAGTFVA
jgi:hypothetical protein